MMINNNNNNNNTMWISKTILQDTEMLVYLRVDRRISTSPEHTDNKNHKA